jgi:hypothetical protein
VLVNTGPKVSRENGDRYDVWNRRVQDGAKFVFGLCGLGYEMFSLHDPRPWAIILWCGLIGLPLPQQFDRLVRERKTEDG